MSQKTTKAGGKDMVDGPRRGEVSEVSGLLWPMWVGRTCLIVALLGAGYLARTVLAGGAVAGCGPNSGCERVLSSHWAYWLGFPVSIPGFAVYLGLLGMTFIATSRRTARTRQASLYLTIALSLLVLGGALWFFLLQRLVIHAWCKFCLATHASAGAAACLLLWDVFRRCPHMQPQGLIAPSRRVITWSVCGAIIGLAVLIVGQVALKKRLFAVTYLPRQAGVSRQLLLHDGRFRLDPKELPVLGSSDATNFIVSMFDYTCSHCRALHPLLKAVEKRYPGLGIITLPVPMDADCNPLMLLTPKANEGACEYARLGLAVWRAKPEAFERFHDWVFASTELPPLGEVRAKAEQIVGKDALHRALKSSWVAQQLQSDIALYQANGRLLGDARLPQLVVGGVISHGAIDNLEDLVELIQRHMQVGPTQTNTIPSAAH